MARAVEPTTPASDPRPSQNKGGNQRSILGFFQKQQALPTRTSPRKARATPASSSISPRDTPKPPDSTSSPSPSLGPGGFSSPVKTGKHASSPRSGQLSPITPPSSVIGADANKKETRTSLPGKRAKNQISYEESDFDSGNESGDFKDLPSNRLPGRSTKRRKTESSSDNDFKPDRLQSVETPDVSDEDPDDVVVKPTRRRPALPKTASSSVPSTPNIPKVPTEEMDIPSTSSALQWTFDPQIDAMVTVERPKVTSKARASLVKPKAHATEPEQRYPWLANLLDADRHPPSHPDFDPRTIYIPPLAWNKFSPFEKQYWEIKQNFWDTIVFFKKGKFYELYENDATIGHQLFDLKLTDRVNMRMVGVPEASLDHWANQFVAKGFKIARVDQMESALAKEMRERDDKTPKKPQKEDKVIRRELASVLTLGTLTDGGMLQNDMSTYCVAIKESEIDGHPAFGIAFVDTATAQFQLVDFIDDLDLTQFETFAAQIRPGELLLEKACLSTRALRVLKSNTGPTTIWNHLKPTKEFWPADITVRELETCGYFQSDSDDDPKWPPALTEARSKDLVMSAFGALVHYLRVCKIDKDLVSLGNILWYNPIRRGSTLVLDGQSLTNLEIFANSHDGGIDGTLFSILNHCVTPFGKRQLRKWVCHPLANPSHINARLDVVDILLADPTVMDRFTSSLSKLPDLERLLSRIHAKRCKVQDFVKVLEGFEQIEYTFSLIQAYGEGEGLLGQLIKAMPDLKGFLEEWQTAFDKKAAKQSGILIPERGVETDFDASTDAIEDCEKELENLLMSARKTLGSNAICYRDNGKEIYQLEVPLAVVKKVPASWDQMSATAKVKRYYSPDLRKLVRQLQETRETHAQIVKEVSGRFYSRFDEHYSTWLAAVNIVAQLDCLISLANASSSLGLPRCRPTTIDDEEARSTVQFADLRHPTMLTAVSDFIPNDVALGGGAANLSLLTGANAAGKSTVLRMTCIAVILAQLGCYVPASAARITPCDRIMSRLGANDNIMQQQSTFFVELAETKKMLAEATSRSLVIIDELGRGTSSVDGLAVAEATLHHVAGAVGCIGFFATHYHAVAHEFAGHPEITPMRMAINVDDEARSVTFLYKLEPGIAEGSFGMHCASMCGIQSHVVQRAEEAASRWEHSGRISERIEQEREKGRMRLGWCSDVAWALKDQADLESACVSEKSLEVLRQAIETM